MKQKKLLSLLLAAVLAIGSTVTALGAPVTKPEPLKSLPDSLEAKEVATMYSLNIKDQSYHQISGTDLDDLRGALNKLEMSKGAPPDASMSEKNGFLVVLTDGTRYTYYITKEKAYCTDSYFKSTQAQRDELLRLNEAYNTKYTGCPRWLAYMNITKMDKITSGGTDSKQTGKANLDTKDKEALAAMDKAFKNLRVKRGETTVNKNVYRNINTDEKAIYCRIYFNTDIDFTIMIEDTMLYIESSDRTTTMEYTIADKAQIDALRDVMKEQAKRVGTFTTIPL